MLKFNGTSWSPAAAGSNAVAFRAENDTDGSSLTVDIASGQGQASFVSGATVNATGSGYNFNGTRGAARMLLHDSDIRFYTASTVTGTTGAAVTGLTIGSEKVIINSTGLDVYGNIAVSGTTVHTSDRRLKKEIRPIKDALEKITSLEGVTYNWKD